MQTSTRGAPEADQNPQKLLDGVNPLSTLSLYPYRELNILLYRCIANPQNNEHRTALEGHLDQRGATYLQNPAMRRKTAALIEDFVHHPTNQEPGKIPPPLQGLHQFNMAFKQVRQAVRPLSSQTQPALNAGFQKLENTLSSLSTGKFGAHSPQTVQRAILNSTKVAYNITHRGIESATMQQHRMPANDAEAKTIAQAQQKLREAREKFHKDLQKGVTLALKAGKQTAEVTINFVPGGQVVGLTKTLTTATGALVKIGQTIQTANVSAKALSATAKTAHLNGAKTAGVNGLKGVPKEENKSGPLQTAERIAQAGSQIDSGLKRMNHKSAEQIRHTQELQSMPRMI
jgi:hypothetical protein